MVTRVRVILYWTVVLMVLMVLVGVNGAPQASQNVKDYDDGAPDDNANSTHSRLGRQGGTILCYVGSWANYRPETKDFRPLKHIDGSLCTHAIYAFARLCDNGTLCPSENGNSMLDEDNLSYRGVGALKGKWPDLRVGVSIGGWAEGSERFSLLAASSWSRNQFINALIETLRRYNMTAVELAWISPTIRSGGKTYDRENYVDLIKDVSRALRPRGWHLGVAVKVDDGKVDSYYDVAAIARFADWLHIQAFDFHGHWEEFTGLNAPLRWIEGDQKNVEYWMKHVAKRAGAEKLLLGMPLFGRSWRMVPSPVPGGPGAASLGAATYDGLVSYKELCAKLKSDEYPPWEVHWDNVSMTPWAVQEYTSFISYDDPRSLVAKVDFARKMNVAGVAVFTIDQDDYIGECGQGKFPLMHAIKAAIDERVAEN